MTHINSMQEWAIGKLLGELGDSAPAFEDRMGRRISSLSADDARSFIKQFSKELKQREKEVK